MTPLKLKIEKGKSSELIKCEPIIPTEKIPINSIKDIVWTFNERKIDEFSNFRIHRNELVIEDASDANKGVLKCMLVDFHNNTAQAETLIEVSEPEKVSLPDESKPRMHIVANRYKSIQNISSIFKIKKIILI